MKVAFEQRPEREAGVNRYTSRKRVFQSRCNSQAKTLSLEGTWLIEWALDH